MMKKIYLITVFKQLFFFCSIISFFSVSAQVGVGTNSPNTSSMLDVSSTDKGLLIPRMTTAQRDAIANPATGLLIFNVSTNQFNYYNGSWNALSDSGTYVDTTSNQTVGGMKTFTGDFTPQGRLMIPMGELSYYNYSPGYTLSFSSSSTGASGTDNMIKINPPSGVSFINDSFGSGTNTRLVYTGTAGRFFHIALSFSFIPGSNSDTYVFGVAKNGVVQDSSKIFNKATSTSDHQSSAMHVLLWLTQNDYVEFYVGRIAGPSITIKSFNFVAIGM